MRSSDDDLFDDLGRSLSCGGSQSDVRLQSQPLCYRFYAKNRVYLGVKTCEVFLCFVTIMFVLSFVLTSLFSLFYVTREGDRFLHRGWAEKSQTKPLIV